MPASTDNVIVSQDLPLYAALAELARHARLVFFAGLPGTGKSLMIQQLAHLAHALGRTISLLQWDVARPAFEASESGRRYPQVQGVTHGLIRLAVGRWARDRMVQWYEQHPGSQHLLIGETPLVGHRLIELARPANAGAESVLMLESSRFVVPIPSREVRRHLEAERERRAQHPVHQREKEDAPPDVLRELWQELVFVARALDLAPLPSRSDGDVPYDPLIYERVYTHILRHRRTQVLPLDVVLPARMLSAYHFSMPSTDLTPSEGEVEHYLRLAEETHPDPAALQREIERWYVIE